MCCTFDCYFIFLSIVTVLRASVFRQGKIMHTLNNNINGPKADFRIRTRIEFERRQVDRNVHRFLFKSPVTLTPILSVVDSS